MVAGCFCCCVCLSVDWWHLSLNEQKELPVLPTAPSPHLTSKESIMMPLIGFEDLNSCSLQHSHLVVCFNAGDSSATQGSNNYDIMLAALILQLHKTPTITILCSLLWFFSQLFCAQCLLSLLSSPLLLLTARSRDRISINNWLKRTVDGQKKIEEVPDNQNFVHAYATINSINNKTHFSRTLPPHHFLHPLSFLL